MICSSEVEPRLKDLSGFCDQTSHFIGIVDPKEKNGNIDNEVELVKQIIRHEIIHAFMYASGLGDSWEHKEYGHDETIVDWNKEVPKKYLYEQDKKCYELLNKSIKEHNTIYQYRRVYVRDNKNGVCPTLTANMGTGGHNVPLIYTNYNKIRKLLPIECLMLQGFPNDFIIPSNLVDSRVYKQAGNAVSVNVIKRVAERILDAIKETENANNKL